MKQRWAQITDEAEAAALIANGKFREDKPTIVRRSDALWVLVNEQFQKWRANLGKRL